MYFTDWLRTVWANLNRMRGRVVLTAFGVVIGTMAVMVLVSLGAGLQRSATGSLGDIANLKRIEVSGAMMGRMAAYTGQQITWEQALNSQERLVPEKVDWNGSHEAPGLAKPGITKFV